MKFKCEGCSTHCVIEMIAVKPEDVRYCVIDGKEEIWKKQEFRG